MALRKHIFKTLAAQCVVKSL